MAASLRLGDSRKTTAILLDITGVLYESGEGGGKVIQGSPEAVKSHIPMVLRVIDDGRLSRLRQAGYKLRFCTNETQITQRALVEKLQRLGFGIEEEEVHCPAPACRQFLSEHNLRPYLLVHPAALPDYEGVDTSNPNAVVLGDATTSFTYDNLNRAFRILTNQPGTALISLGQGRYYREGSSLTLDVGPYMKALEYATGLQAQVIGKPLETFFMSAVKQMGVAPENTIMIGDDIVSDVGGAQRCGLAGVLVRTGKYRPDDEKHATVTPDLIVDNLAQFVDLLLNPASRS